MESGDALSSLSDHVGVAEDEVLAAEDSVGVAREVVEVADHGVVGAALDGVVVADDGVGVVVLLEGGVGLLLGSAEETEGLLLASAEPPAEEVEGLLAAVGVDEEEGRDEKLHFIIFCFPSLSSIHL
mgnify:CR=1 FL=1